MEMRLIYPSGHTQAIAHRTTWWPLPCVARGILDRGQRKLVATIQAIDCGTTRGRLLQKMGAHHLCGRWQVVCIGVRTRAASSPSHRRAQLRSHGMANDGPPSEGCGREVPRLGRVTSKQVPLQASPPCRSDPCVLKLQALSAHFVAFVWLSIDRLAPGARRGVKQNRCHRGVVLRENHVWSRGRSGFRSSPKACV